MALKVEAVAGYNSDITVIKGDEKQYFRIDDKKNIERVKPDSKYHLVCISAKKIITLTVGQRDNKYSLTTNEYITDEGWAKAIHSKLNKKIVRPITEEKFYKEFQRFIIDVMEEGK
jgi:hypothetical protein